MIKKWLVLVLLLGGCVALSVSLEKDKENPVEDEWITFSGYVEKNLERVEDARVVITTDGFDDVYKEIYTDRNGEFVYAMSFGPGNYLVEARAEWEGEVDKEQLVFDVEEEDEDEEEDEEEGEFNFTVEEAVAGGWTKIEGVAEKNGSSWPLAKITITTEKGVSTTYSNTEGRFSAMVQLEGGEQEIHVKAVLGGKTLEESVEIEVPDFRVEAEESGGWLEGRAVYANGLPVKNGEVSLDSQKLGETDSFGNFYFKVDVCGRLEVRKSGNEGWVEFNCTSEEEEKENGWVWGNETHSLEVDVIEKEDANTVLQIEAEYDNGDPYTGNVTLFWEDESKTVDFDENGRVLVRIRPHLGRKTVRLESGDVVEEVTFVVEKRWDLDISAPKKVDRNFVATVKNLGRTQENVRVIFGNYTHDIYKIKEGEKVNVAIKVGKPGEYTLEVKGKDRAWTKVRVVGDDVKEEIEEAQPERGDQVQNRTEIVDTLGGERGNETAGNETVGNETDGGVVFGAPLSNKSGIMIAGAGLLLAFLFL